MVRLLCDVGGAPACSVGSACTNMMTNSGMMGGNCGDFGNPLGAITVIPMCAIACFTHNAI